MSAMLFLHKSIHTWQFPQESILTSSHLFPWRNKKKCQYILVNNSSLFRVIHVYINADQVVPSCVISLLSQLELINNRQADGVGLVML